ncbi:MAG TPA: hypothetical protein VKE51_37005 [Vicinamibacterales bacterium]|nr:hypothetical protein [Vicinamibacterales bacterium]
MHSLKSDTASINFRPEGALFPTPTPLQSAFFVIRRATPIWFSTYLGFAPRGTALETHLNRVGAQRVHSGRVVRQEEQEHMVTNHAHSIASQDEVRETAVGENLDGLGGRVIDRLRQMYCGLHGHDTLLQFEQDRMYLRCVSCGHETPGWELNETPPTVTLRGDARRHRMARPQLVRARRIA